jgi:chaperonin GroES
MAKKKMKKPVSKKSPKKSAPQAKAAPQEPVQPLFDRVLIRKEDPKESMTAGGIYVPESAKKGDAPKVGVVLAVGPGRFDNNGNRIPVSVAVGMKVMFTPGWAGADVVEGLSGNNVIVPETDILAILNN